MNSLRAFRNKLNSLFNGEESGFKVVGDYWFARYSNAFKDKDGEYFPVKAIDAYIARVDHGLVPPPDVWVWHDGIGKFGKAKAIARIEKIIVAWGTFDKTPQGIAAKAYFQTHKAEMSHGFMFNPETFIDNAYHDFNTFEITVLPFGKGVEANPYTSFEVKEMTMTPEKRAFFVEVFGEETAKDLIEKTEKASKSLEDIGIQFKDFVDVAALKAEDDPKKKPPAEDEVDDGTDPEATMDGEPDPNDPNDPRNKKDIGVKALYAQLVGDFAELAGSQLIVAKALKDINIKMVAQAKSHSDVLTLLREENKNLRETLALSPRASQDDKTIVVDKDLQKNLDEKEKGAQDSFWNFALNGK